MQTDIEGHQFRVTFCPQYSRWGETVGSHRGFYRNSKASHRNGGEGGFSGTGKGPIPLREEGGEGDTKW